ncbi:DUF1415 domain-containing protein [Vibrio sp. S4M6]|uniref:DUF1415 domain-containing protein n=1 Tax=Vibrio sinus TaxID=2946865 RepID=UPI00202A69FF|nr:DUF1415 domain-containing protein [Vibrio sinus]MCL9783173.1 DUF1415 domain-containing protein [Vibrio sinus]
MNVSPKDKDTITAHVEQWLQQVVIGLNLCPFAAKPARNNQIKIAVSDAKDEESLLSDILQQLNILQSTAEDELETTLVVVPNMLADFDDYNLFITWVEALIKQEQLEGIYQVATFHPDYCFAGNQPDDADNLTNRSPYPIFHLIREEGLERALRHFPNPESIPETNINRVNQLSQSDIARLFPYLVR